MLPLGATQIRNAHFTATERNLVSKGVAIVSPCFLAEVDKSAGAGQLDDFAFRLTTWASGQKATSPVSATTISSYDIIDALVETYLDLSKYPKVQVGLPAQV